VVPVEQIEHGERTRHRVPMTRLGVVTHIDKIIEKPSVSSLGKA
jgi:hypothetical protein